MPKVISKCKQKAKETDCCNRQTRLKNTESKSGSVAESDEATKSLARR